MPRILLVEDDDSLRQVLQTFLESAGYLVVAENSAENGVQRLEDSKFDLVLSDFKLGDSDVMTGIEFLKLVRQKYSSLPFLVMTAYASIELALEAIKSGANDFICKPFQAEQLGNIIKQILTHRQVVDREDGTSKRNLRTLITQNPATLRILEQARKVAKVDSAVLILGESGTGKELVARFIHENSPRKDKSFHAINSAAMPAELLESELFGHEAGAFTGATQTRMGLFEIANEGTIFLDEIGEMPPHLQVKLLRVLQEKEIKRVGGSKTIKVNPRIISATNCDIERALLGGTLREDLYYRLAVVTLKIPPLRERPEDIELLLNFYLQFFCAKHGKKLSFTKEAIEVARQHSWRGNVRELENRMERAVLLSEGVVELESLGLEPRLNIDFGSLKEATSLLAVAERAAQGAEIEMIMKSLAQTGGNKSKAATLLGVSYKTLLNKIKAYNLDFRP